MTAQGFSTVNMHAGASGHEILELGVSQLCRHGHACKQAANICIVMQKVQSRLRLDTNGMQHASNTGPSRGGQAVSVCSAAAKTMLEGGSPHVAALICSREHGSCADVCSLAPHRSCSAVEGRHQALQQVQEHRVGRPELMHRLLTGPHIDSRSRMARNRDT